MRITVLSREDSLHFGRVFARLFVNLQGRKDFQRRRVEPALGQKPVGGFATPRMDKAKGLNLQSDFLQRPVKITFPLNRVDETGTAVLLQDASGGLHYIKNAAFNLMLGDGFFLGVAEMPSHALDIRRVAKNEVELLLRPKSPEVLLQDNEFFFEAIEGNISAGQVGQAGLALQADDPPERPPAEEKREYPVSCS